MEGGHEYFSCKNIEYFVEKWLANNLTRDSLVDALDIRDIEKNLGEEFMLLAHHLYLIIRQSTTSRIIP